MKWPLAVPEGPDVAHTPPPVTGAPATVKVPCPLIWSVVRSTAEAKSDPPALIVGTPFGKVRLIVSQRILGEAPAAVGVMLPERRSKINATANSITNPSLDFTTHLLFLEVLVLVEATVRSERRRS